MKKIIASFILLASLPLNAYAVYVSGYYRSNGTYVAPHERTAPDGNPYNNYSYPGNYNPNTGSITGGNPDTYLNNYYNNSSPSYSGYNYSYPTTPTCPINSYYDGISSCKCDYGYVIGTSGQCTNAGSVCMAQLGLMSQYNSSSKQCECMYGYEFNGLNCVYKTRDYSSTYVPSANTSYSQPVKKTDSTCKQTSGSSAYLDTNTNTCACSAGYWMRDGKCVEPGPYCSSVLGFNSHPTSDSCVCDDGYNGYSGICAENYKEEKTVEYEIKSWLDQGGKCNNNPHFSLKQQQDCVVYQANPNTFRWKVLDKIEVQPAITNTLPLTQNTTPKNEVEIIKINKTPRAAEVLLKESPKDRSQKKEIKNEKVIFENPKIEVSTTTQINPEPQKNSAKKIWYKRLNPFSWFK